MALLNQVDKLFLLGNKRWQYLSVCVLETERQLAVQFQESIGSVFQSREEIESRGHKSLYYLRDEALLTGTNFGSCFLFSTQLVALPILGSWDYQHKIVRRQQFSKSIYLGAKNCNLAYTDLGSNTNGALTREQTQGFCCCF